MKGHPLADATGSFDRRRLCKASHWHAKMPSLKPLLVLGHLKSTQFEVITSPMVRLSGSRQKSDAPSQGVSKRPFLEFQYHPSDIRKGVRYVFMSRRQVVAWGVGLTVYALFLVFSLGALPKVLKQQWTAREYAQQALLQPGLALRVETNVDRFESLEETSNALRLELGQIHLAYGFDQDESLGKGGYPHTATPLPGALAGSGQAEKVQRGFVLQADIEGQMGALSALLAEVQSFEELNRDAVNTTPSISPVRSDEFVLTSPYGMRISPFTKEKDFHAGLDLAAATGTDTLAPSDGVVTFAGRYSLRRSVGWWRYGNLVALRHGDRFISLYGHLDEIKVQVGDEVKQGDVIGTVGDTGWSTNPHLHYEVRRLNEEKDIFEPVDPRIYILDHRWRDAEQMLIRARHAPVAGDFEPLPRRIRP